MAAICGNFASFSTPSYALSSHVLTGSAQLKKKTDISGKNKPNNACYIYKNSQKGKKDSIPSVCICEKLNTKSIIYNVAR